MCMEIPKIVLPEPEAIQRVITKTLNGFDWSGESKDLILLIIFGASILIHLLFLKKNKIFAVLMAIYSSFLVVLFFPYHLWLSGLSIEKISTVDSISFTVLTLILSVVFSKAHIFGKLTKGLFGGFFNAVMMGILNLGLFLSLLSNFLPEQYLNDFSGLVLNIFTTETARFIWVIAPLLFILIFVRIKIRRRGPGRPPVE